MESFRPPAPLRLTSSNLEADWSSFEKKFNWFLVAIGADKKPDGIKLAMFLTTVGDDAVKVFEAFTYDEGESAERFDVVVRKFREYCTPLRAFLLATRPDARRKYRPVRYAPAPSGEILQLPGGGQYDTRPYCLNVSRRSTQGTSSA